MPIDTSFVPASLIHTFTYTMNDDLDDFGPVQQWIGNFWYADVGFPAGFSSEHLTPLTTSTSVTGSVGVPANITFGQVVAQLQIRVQRMSQDKGQYVVTSSSFRFSTRYKLTLRDTNVGPTWSLVFEFVTVNTPFGNTDSVINMQKSIPVTNVGDPNIAAFQSWMLARVGTTAAYVGTLEILDNNLFSFQLAQWTRDLTNVTILANYQKAGITYGKHRGVTDIGWGWPRIPPNYPVNDFVYHLEEEWRHTIIDTKVLWGFPDTPPTGTAKAVTHIRDYPGNHVIAFVNLSDDVNLWYHNLNDALTPSSYSVQSGTYDFPTIMLNGNFLELTYLDLTDGSIRHARSYTHGRDAGSSGTWALSLLTGTAGYTVVTSCIHQTGIVIAAYTGNPGSTGQWYIYTGILQTDGTYLWAGPVSMGLSSPGDRGELRERWDKTLEFVYVTSGGAIGVARCRDLKMVDATGTWTVQAVGGSGYVNVTMCHYQAARVILAYSGTPGSGGQWYTFTGKLNTDGTYTWVGPVSTAITNPAPRGELRSRWDKVLEFVYIGHNDNGIGKKRCRDLSVDTATGVWKTSV